MTAPDTARRKWLAMLAKLTAPMHPVEATKALCDMLPFLADMPDAAFTLASLEHVAASCRHGCPNFGDLRAPLAEWWHDNRPAPTNLLAGPTPQQDRERTAATQAQCRADWGDPAIVRAKIRDVEELQRDDCFMAGYLRSMLRLMVGKWAPENLGLLPPTWLDDGAAVTLGARGEFR
jgi:hypothetical protein